MAGQVFDQALIKAAHARPTQPSAHQSKQTACAAEAAAGRARAGAARSVAVVSGREAPAAVEAAPATGSPALTMHCQPACAAGLSLSHAATMRGDACTARACTLASCTQHLARGKRAPPQCAAATGHAPIIWTTVPPAKSNTVQELMLLSQLPGFHTCRPQPRRRGRRGRAMSHALATDSPCAAPGHRTTNPSHTHSQACSTPAALAPHASIAAARACRQPMQMPAHSCYACAGWIIRPSAHSERSPSPPLLAPAQTHSPSSPSV